MSETPTKEKSPETSPKARVSRSPRQGSSPTRVASKSPPKSPSSPGAGELLPGDHWNDETLEAHVEAEAEDPTLGEYDSSTASLSSSILAYRTIQGRTYHSDHGTAEYWASNDVSQNESMDILHHVHTLALEGKLFLAPIKDDIQKTLDIGTGTGTWAIDFGDQYPGCEVIGTDVSPIQPGWVPPNVKFQIDDCEQAWTFEPDSIDFVHMRYLTGSIKDWFRLFKQAFIATKPGGYVESYEASPYIISDDGTVKEGSAMAQWGPLFVAGGEQTGRSFTMYEEGTQRAAMEEAGLINIQERNLRMPLGKWPKDPRMKELGEYGYAVTVADVEGYVLYMANLLGWSKEEVAVYSAHFRREIRNPGVHGYYMIKVIWGQKPGGM